MLAFGLGLAHRAADGTILDVYFPHPLHAPSEALATGIREVLGPIEGSTTIEVDDARLGRLVDRLDALGAPELANAARALKGARMLTVATVLEGDDPIGTTGEAYLKLHLLSLKAS